MDAPWYQRPAMAEGWVVLASDATIPPREDSTAWRLALLAATLQTIRREWPQSAHWPVAFAGLSGGAKLSGVIGAMLASTNAVKPCGFFLAGINDDRLSVAYKAYHPPADFLNTPIWLSSGMNDPRAPYTAHEHVRASLVNTGFKRVRLETFPGAGTKSTRRKSNSRYAGFAKSENSSRSDLTQKDLPWSRRSPMQLRRISENIRPGRPCVSNRFLYGRTIRRAACYH
jgi:pimeloyl-ACP methyl ester carboxylesterase